MIPLIVGLVVLACYLFFIGAMQLDTLFWDCVDYHWACETIWIPEFGVSVKNVFIIMFLAMVAGFTVALISVLLLLCMML